MISDQITKREGVNLREISVVIAWGRGMGGGQFPYLSLVKRSVESMLPAVFLSFRLRLGPHNTARTGCNKVPFVIPCQKFG